jgi:predicted O-linked N-acetylglucosamine transferase (SPINDLY family)
MTRNSMTPQGTAGRAADLFAQAVALHQRGSIAEAERAYRLVLSADKRHAGALQYLAMLEGQRGNVAEAVRLLKQCVKVVPRAAEVHTNLGYALALMNRHEEALSAYDKALAINPNFLPALNNRGISLREMKRLADAVANYDRALALKPDFADAHYNRGNVLNKMGRWTEALASLDRALALKPGDVDTLIAGAIALRGLGRQAEALACLDKVVALAPGNVLALVNRGDILSDLRRYDEAIGCYEKALSLDPDHAYARSTLAWAVLSVCDWDRLEAMRADLLARVREKRAIVQPFTLLSVSDDPALQHICAEAFVSDAFPLSPRQTLAAAPRRGGAGRDRIRVVYLSVDFRRHPTVYLVARLLELHDRSRFTVLGVSTGLDDASAERKRIIDAVDEFIDASDKGDREVARLLHERQADILVDLNAHTRGGRLGILAHRPAPLQVNYLGYPGTSGAPFVDYIIADATILPADRQPFFAEKIVRLPDYYTGYHLGHEVAAPTPARGDVGLPERGFVFCSFNNNYKITAPVFDAWMRLLLAVEGSVLWLLGDTPAAETNLRKEAAKRGVDPARLIFAVRTGTDEHLARQRLADLFLDTLPVNAHTTACDALWMGLPLVTCAGQAFAGRVAASALTSCGLPDLVTTSLGDYEALARTLATDPGLLANYRERLAGLRASAPLFDPDRLRRQIEAAYARMWEIHCKGERPRGFDVERT